MDTNDPITAEVFSAFLKCPTKAHLLAIGEPVPDTYFADIEAGISSMYKAGAKRRLSVGAELAEPLDFGELWRSPDCATVTHEVDCETAVYDFTLPQRRPGGAPTAGIQPSGPFVPVLFSPWDKPRRFRQPARVFRCARAVAGHRDTARYRNTDLWRWLPPKNREDRGPRRPDTPNHRRDLGKLPRSEATSTGPEQALRRLRLPAEVSRASHRT